MAAFDPYRPITTSHRLQTPRGHRLFTTTRKNVPAEYQLPTIGATMAADLGAGGPWSNNIIYEINEDPTPQGGLTISIKHTALPSVVWTTHRYLEVPANHKIYTSHILIPIDPVNYPIPEEGVQLSSISYLGISAPNPLAANYVSQVQYVEAYGGYHLALTHVGLPANVAGYDIFESSPYTFPPLYPEDPPIAGNPFPNGSVARPRMVIGRVNYKFGTAADLTTWRGEATVWDYSNRDSGPFEVDSLIARAATVNFTDADGASGQVGDFLEPSFISSNTVHPAIQIYSPGSILYNIAASRPSLSAYVGYIVAKQEIIAQKVVEEWYGGLFVKKTTYVRAQ